MTKQMLTLTKFIAFVNKEAQARGNRAFIDHWSGWGGCAVGLFHDTTEEREKSVDVTEDALRGIVPSVISELESQASSKPHLRTWKAFAKHLNKIKLDKLEL